MNLWLISQTVNNGWDTYDSAVVCAETKEEAKYIHPGDYKTWNGEDDDFGSSWTSAKNVKVQYLGKADDSIKEGVVLASYNAG